MMVANVKKFYSSCTTILVGKAASYDGSTIVARTEDSANGQFAPKRFVVVTPEEQPKVYTSVISGVTITLPENPMRYTSVPNAILDDGLWAEAGINDANVAVSATETITTNERVLGADPMVPGGIGEEDITTIVLPYIHSAREGVELLGQYLEKYGTYEHNGIAFSDIDEIWWLETIGGHHWIAKRVPDDAYVTNPNQLGIQEFRFDDPDNYMAASDLEEWVAQYHLNLSLDGTLNARDAFGSHTDKDHHYNTPRAWYIQKKLTPTMIQDPMSDDIPWSNKPTRKITIEDVNDVLSSHYQDTPYDPYGKQGDEQTRKTFRPIGINRNGHLSILQIRPNVPAEIAGVQWLAYSSQPFNTMVPFYTNVGTTPAAFANTTAAVTTDSFYWTNRIIAALASPVFDETVALFEDYTESTMAAGHLLLNTTDAAVIAGVDDVQSVLATANQQIADAVVAETRQLLADVLFTASNLMANHFSRND